MLTEVQCKSAKAVDKPQKVADAQGLHLCITPVGHKSWRYKYRFGGKERRIVFGSYPEISLCKLRELREGRDPGEEYRWHSASRTAGVASIGSALRPVIQGKQPALLKLNEARAFLRAFEAGPGHITTKLASRLLALTAAQPGTVQMAERQEFEDLAGSQPIWCMPAKKMKLQLAQSELLEFEGQDDAFVFWV